MDLDLGPEIAQFRAELRDWIAANAPDGLAGLTDWNMARPPAATAAPELARRSPHPEYAEWEASAGRRQADLPAVAGGVRRPGHGRACGSPC